MAIHFSETEMSARKARLLAAMAAERLDGLLLFAQESDYWLTGYDSFGFCFFQCLYVGADGRVALLTRSPDLRQARHTSNIADIRIWKDGAGADPTRDLRAMLDDLGAGGRSAWNSTATVSRTSRDVGSRRRWRAAQPSSTPPASCPACE